MKVSIVTAVLNRSFCIEDCLNSVAGQHYGNIEHIVIDGASSDGTLEILQRRRGDIPVLVSEPDGGIYDAMNKGLKRASGDIIGILNSDDLYAGSDVIDTVAACLEESGADTCYGDLVYISGDDVSCGVRYWKAGAFKRELFRKGWMPPHPTFFVKRHIYEKHGLFNLDFPLAADYELMLRFLYRYNISTTYIPKILVKMRTGGSCRPGFRNVPHNMAENYRAWRVNGLSANPLTFLLKPLSKTLQYLKP